MGRRPNHPMTPRSSAAFFLFAASLLLSGCALATKGRRQQVSISSEPHGATVVVDGVPAGQTPLVTSLPRKVSHRIEVTKEGFVPASVLVRAESNEFARRTIRWGLDIDLGATNDLTPATLELALVPQALAATTYGDAFERMIYAVLAADTLQESGSISDADHRYMIEKIIARYAGSGR